MFLKGREMHFHSMLLYIFILSYVYVNLTFKFINK